MYRCNGTSATGSRYVTALNFNDPAQMHKLILTFVVVAVS